MRSRKLQAVPSANWRPRKASAVSSMSKAGEEECSSSSNQAESKSGSERVRENERDRKNKFPFLPFEFSSGPNRIGSSAFFTHGFRCCCHLEIPSQTQQEIRFSQISGHPVAQSRRHRKLVITARRIRLGTMRLRVRSLALLSGVR